MAKSPTRTLLSPEFRLSFCNMIVAKEFKEKGKGTGKFSYITDCLFVPADMEKFQMLGTEGQDNGKLVTQPLGVILANLAKEAWGTEIDPETNAPITVQKMFAGVAMKGWPIKSGDTIADRAKAAGKDYEQYRGTKVISIKSNVSEKSQPPILSKADASGKKVFNRVLPSDMEIAKQLFQGGNYAIAEINAVANVVGGMKYLTMYVNSLRFTREGAKFGRSGGDLMERFGGVSGGTSERTDVTGDEIPF